MSERKLLSFSPCGEYFVCSNETGTLTIWETSSNNVKQECDVNTQLNTICSTLIWGSFENTIIKSVDGEKGCQLLVLGTEEGNVYLFDYCTGKIVPHFVSGHTDVVNDLSLHLESNRLFSCSSEKSIIIWDVPSGKIIKKWNADDEEIYSICVVDNNNLLTASTSILWWNIEEQNIIKRFSSHQTPVIFLHTVNSADVSSSYFLAAASGESKISAWSLNEKTSTNAVATFVLPEEAKNVNANKCFSKDNPLLLTAVTKSGNLLLFQHVLNGNTKNLTPQMTLKITSTAIKSDSSPVYIPIISSKILDCAESCIIAYGSADNPVFESVNIFDCPKTLTLARENPVKNSTLELNINRCTKLKECTLVNGVNGQTSAILSSYSSPIRRKHKETEIENMCTSENKCLEDSSATEIDTSRISKTLSPNKKKKKSKKNSNDSDIEEIISIDPSEMSSCLIKGIEENRTSLVDSVLQCNNSETIRSTVRSFPLQSLNIILLELYRRLRDLQEKRYHLVLLPWVSEIMYVHLAYLNICEDKELKRVIKQLKKFIEERKASEILLKLNMIRGLYNIQVQTNSPDEERSSTSQNASEEEDLMES